MEFSVKEIESMRKSAFVIIALFLVLAFPFTSFAQEQDIENLQIGVETAGQLLADINVSHFEDADSWVSNIPIDKGIVISMRRKGRPLEVPEVDPKDGTANEYVLGVKVQFNQRGYATFSIKPPKPIKIPGVTKALSVWIAGRNFKHQLYAHIIDYKGREMILNMGLLDFSGWKRVNITVPPSIAQYNYHNPEWLGISFAGFSVKCDPEETYGTYYIYFDELRAITNVYTEEHRGEDDMEDGW